MDKSQRCVDSYTAENEYIEDTTVSNGTIESTGTDENAALISSGVNVTLDNDTITRTTADSQGGDNSSFYGKELLFWQQMVLPMEGCGSVNTDAAGGAGAFCSMMMELYMLLVQL